MSVAKSQVDPEVLGVVVEVTDFEGDYEGQWKRKWESVRAEVQGFNRMDEY